MRQKGCCCASGRENGAARNSRHAARCCRCRLKADTSRLRAAAPATLRDGGRRAPNFNVLAGAGIGFPVPGKAAGAAARPRRVLLRLWQGSDGLLLCFDELQQSGHRRHQPVPRRTSFWLVDPPGSRGFHSASATGEDKPRSPTLAVSPGLRHVRMWSIAKWPSSSTRRSAWRTRRSAAIAPWNSARRPTSSFPHQVEPVVAGFRSRSSRWEFRPMGRRAGQHDALRYGDRA